jgi:hypothetical protein
MQENLKSEDSELPVVCLLLVGDQAQRFSEVTNIFSGYAQIRELTDGYAFRFEDSVKWAGRILEFIEAERVCCQFLRFDLIFEPQLGPLWLQLRGSETAKEFIRVNFISNGFQIGRSAD